MNIPTCTATNNTLSYEEQEEQRVLKTHLSERVKQIMLAQPLNPFVKLDLSVYVG